jgi:hypothetical protein
MRAPRARTGRFLLATAAVTGAALAATSVPALGATADAPERQLQTVAAHARDAGTPQGPARELRSLSDTVEAAAVTGSNMFFDAIGDNEVLALDLQRMLAFTSDDGRYTVSMSMDTNTMVDGDFLSTFVNTDGNAATGNATFGGADIAVAITGYIGTDVVTTMRWNGVGWDPVAMPSLISFASGTTDQVWSIAASELGIAPGTATTLVFGSSYASSYFDFAPDFGAPFTFVAGGGAPAAPPPPPAPVAPVAPPSPAASTITAPATYPLSFRGLSFSTTPTTLRASIRWTRGSGRVTWDLRLRTVVGGRTVTKLVRGAGQAGTRTVNRTVQIPATWRGRTISARLLVRNEGGSIVRTRSVRF